MKNATGTLLILLILLVCHACSASVPAMMNYQGKLTNDLGQPVADGSHSLTFKLYSIETGGTVLWAETQSVQVTGGVFSVLLGSVSALPDSAFQGTTWLETTVGSTTLAPRTRIVSVGYSLRSKTAETVPSSAITSSMLGTGSVTSAKILDGTIAYADLSSSAVSSIAKATRAGDSVFNVKDYGAVGNGTTDDTAAFQSAITAAKTVTGVVHVPSGTYRITSSLTVENCAVIGIPAGGWCADTQPLPTFKVDFTTGPCIIAKAGASIHGVRFTYDHQGQEARVFGPTISVQGIGVSLTNLTLNEPYEGILSDGVNNNGRLNLENIFMINARKCGVYVTNTYDIATLRNVEVWNYASYCLSNCIGFKLGKNDELRMDNCFALQCHTAFKFIQDTGGPTWGGMVNCTADACQFGAKVEAASKLRITGGSLMAHWTSLEVAGPGHIIVTGVDMQSNGATNLIVTNCDSMTVSGCTFTKAGSGWPSVYKVELSGGKSTLISGCTFDDNSAGIHVNSGVRSVSVTGNLFQQSSYTKIQDDSGSSTRKVIANNLT